MEPMARVIEAVIEASKPGGLATGYLQREGYWEGPLRRRFALLCADVAGNRPTAAVVAHSAVALAD